MDEPGDLLDLRPTSIPAELYVREVCTAGEWRNSELGKRIVQQLCRELLLLESSDWQFLITTGAARDYAEMRFLTHNDQFLELKTIWEAFAHDGSLNEPMLTRLGEIEQRDRIFPDIDPSFWAADAHATRIADAGSADPAAKKKPVNADPSASTAGTETVLAQNQ